MQEIKAFFPITEITLYPQSARIYREASVSIDAGTAKLWVQGLPPGITVDSIRVEPLDPKAVRIRDLFTETRYADPLSFSREAEALNRELTELGLKKQLLENTVRNCNDEFLLFCDQDLGKVLGEDGNSVGRPIHSVLWKEYFEFSRGKLLANREKARELLLEWIDISGKYDELSSRAHGLNRTVPQGRSEPVVMVETASSGTRTLRISYLQSGAAWYPAYTLRADPAKAVMSMSMYAMVAQTTSEDWQDVSLLLSTAVPADDCSVPVLKSLRLREAVMEIPAVSASVHCEEASDSECDEAEKCAEPMPDRKAKKMAMPRSEAPLAKGLRAEKEMASGGARSDFFASPLADMPAMPSPSAAPPQRPQSVPKGSSRALKADFQAQSGGQDGLYRMVAEAEGMLSYAFSEAGLPEAFGELRALLTRPFQPVLPGETRSKVPQAFLSGYSLLYSCGGFDYRYSPLGGKTGILTQLSMDEGKYQITVDSRELPMTLKYVSVPLVREEVYLKALFSNKGTPCPQGPAQVFLGNTFVSNIQLPTLSDAQGTEVSLGVDRDVKILRRENMTQRSKGLIGKDLVYDYAVTIEILNGKAIPIVMEIYDRIPIVAEGCKETDVSGVKYAQLPEHTSADGVLRWDKTLKGGETLKLEFSYTLKVKDGYQPVLSQSSYPFQGF